MGKLMNEFVLDIDRVRADARQEMGKGPVTETYGTDAHRVVDVLNRYRHTSSASHSRAEAATTSPTTDEPTPSLKDL
jgi:hypothetical protein